MRRSDRARENGRLQMKKRYWRRWPRSRRMALVGQAHAVYDAIHIQRRRRQRIAWITNLRSRRRTQQYPQRFEITGVSGTFTDT